MYLDAVKDALEVSYQKDKNGNSRLWVKMVGKGEKAYPLLTRNTVTRQLQENPQLSGEIKLYLKKSMLEKINDYKQEQARTQKELAAKQKQLEQAQQSAAESQKLRQDLDAMRNRIKDDEDRIRELEEAHGPLNTEEIQRLKDEKRALEADHQSKRQQLSQLQKNAKQADKIQKDIDKLMLERKGGNRTLRRTQNKRGRHQTT